MADNNLNILAVAKQEYTDSMCQVLLPHVVDVFTEMYERAKIDSKGKNTLIKFQEYLRDIKNWNQGMVKTHTDNISKSCSYFGDLLAAVFVSYVKILSSVRLKADVQKISIKLPGNEEFVYKVFEENAKLIYKNPYIFMDTQNDDDLFEKLMVLNCTAVDTVIKSMVPLQQILNTYMGNTSGEHDISLGPDESPDPVTEEPPMDDEGPMEPPMEEPPAVGESEPMMPEPEVSDGTELPAHEEVKQIPVTEASMRNMQQPPGEDDEDDLFPEAPETPTRKNFAYNKYQ